MLPYIFKVGSVGLSSFFVVMLFGAFFSTFVFWKKTKEEHLEESVVADMFLRSLFFSVLLGRVAYVLLNFSRFSSTPWLVLFYWAAPGLHWSGLMVGWLWTIYKKTKDLSWDFWQVLDLSTIGLSLYSVFLSLASLLGGSIVGKETGFLISVVYKNVSGNRHPVGAHTFVLWVFVFVLLWWLEGTYRKFAWYRNNRGEARTGFLTFTYLIAFGLIGFLSSLMSVSKSIFLGINVDLALRFSLFLFGTYSLIGRSGFVERLNLMDKWQSIFSGWRKNEQ